MYQNYLRLSPSTPYRAMVERHLTSLDRCVRTGQRRTRIAAAVTATGIVVAGLGLMIDRPEVSTGMIAGGLVAAVSGATFALTWEW